MRIYRLRLRLGLVDNYMVERGLAGAISINARWLKLHGYHTGVRNMEFLVKGAHGVLVMLVIWVKHQPHQSTNNY